MAEKIKPLMVIWSPKASANLDDIIAYLKQSWTDKVIRAFFANMELAVERIKQFPTIGRRSATRRNVFLVLLPPHHQIVYQYFPRKKIIAILQLWDTRQHPRKRKG